VPGGCGLGFLGNSPPGPIVTPSWQANLPLFHHPCRRMCGPTSMLKGPALMFPDRFSLTGESIFPIAIQDPAPRGAIHWRTGLMGRGSTPAAPATAAQDNPSIRPPPRLYRDGQKFESVNWGRAERAGWGPGAYTTQLCGRMVRPWRGRIWTSRLDWRITAHGHVLANRRPRRQGQLRHAVFKLRETWR